MTRLNKVRKALQYITGKEVTGDFKTIGQMLDSFNADCEENGLQIGGGDNTFIVTATSTGGSGNSATGYYKYTGVTLDKTVEEIQQAINDGKMVLVSLYSSAVCFQIFPYDDSLTFIGFYYYYDGRAMELNNSVEIVRVHINSDSDIIAEQWPLTTKPSNS